MSTSWNAKFEGLTKYLFIAPDWPRSLAIIVILGLVIDAASFKTGIGIQLIGTLGYIVPAVAAFLLTKPMVELFGKKMTWNRSALLALTCMVFCVILSLLPALLMGNEVYFLTFALAIAFIFALRLLVLVAIADYRISHMFFPALSQLDEPYNGRLQGLEMAYGLHVHDMERERARMQKWERLVEEWSSGAGANVSLDVLPSAEAIEVVSMIESLHTHTPQFFGVNVPNGGAIANLPADAIVEVTCLFDGYGVRPLQVGPLPEPLAALLRGHVAAQQLTAAAGLSGDVHTARQAFLHDPQAQARLGLEAIEQLRSELFEAHRADLPQFGA